MQKKVTSTNEVLKDFAKQGYPDKYVLIAEEQTAGKGRYGRQFYSPSKSGLYMSIILRPNMNVSDALFITTSAAVAVVRAIKTCGDINNIKINPKIKWVNDIYIDNRKVCGILAESAINFKLNKLDYVVLGIGLNVLPPIQNFPDEIKNIATSIFETGNYDDLANELAAEILRELSKLPENFTSPEILDEYRKHSMLIGKDAFAIYKDETKPCHVIGIDDRAGLIVKFQNGEESVLNTGEVSVKNNI